MASLPRAGRRRHNRVNETRQQMRCEVARLREELSPPVEREEVIR